MGTFINSSDLKVLRKAIRELPEDYKDQLKEVEIEEIAQSVEVFKREYLVLNWLNLYVGCQSETLRKVVDELYNLYPSFREEIENGSRGFPEDGKRLQFSDDEYFQAWLRKNSSYIGKTWGSIAWLGLLSKEVNWFYTWKDSQKKYQLGGFGFISFDSWYDKMKFPPNNILTEVKVTPEDYKVVKKGLPSVAQLYADHGGRVAIVQDSTLDIKTEKFLKVGEIAELLQRPVKTIYNWASEGIIPCYRDGGSLRFKWDEVKEWYSQYRKKGRVSRQF